MNDPDDRSLAALAKQGDHAAFTVLISRHKRWLLNSIRRYVRNSDDAMDVLQESFISAWFSIGTYDIQRPFGIWLRRIALNKCRDHGRRNSAYRAAIGSFAVQAEIAGKLTQKPASVDSADKTAAPLMDAISALPQSVRFPLILTAFEGLSHKEAAEVLKLSPKAIEVRVYRAKKMLGENLSPEILVDLIENET